MEWRNERSRLTSKRAFTLIELLVVVAIIALLMAILLPSLSSARKQARMVACGSNMRQIGTAFLIYANENQQQFPPATAAYAGWTLGPTYDAFLGPMLGQSGMDPWKYEQFPLQEAELDRPQKVFVCTEDRAQRTCPSPGSHQFPDYIRSYSYNDSMNSYLSSTFRRSLPISLFTKPSTTILLTENKQEYNILYHGWHANLTSMNNDPLQNIGNLHGADDRANYLWADGHVTVERRVEIAANNKYYQYSQD